MCCCVKLHLLYRSVHLVPGQHLSTPLSLMRQSCVALSFTSLVTESAKKHDVSIKIPLRGRK